MRLFEALGIRHFVLIDGDNGRLKPIDSSIHAANNPFTGGIDRFPNDLEDFLGIPSSRLKHRKPQHVMYHVAAKIVEDARLQEFITKVETLVSN